MIIPEDGCLPRITRSGLTPFNNVMIIQVPEQFREPGETTFQLATLDRTKKGEKWPADKHLERRNATVEESTKSSGKEALFIKDKSKKSKQNKQNRDLFLRKRQSEKKPKPLIKQVELVKRSLAEETVKDGHNSLISRNNRLSEETVNQHFSNIMPHDKIHPWLPNTEPLSAENLLLPTCNQSFPNLYDVSKASGKGLLGDRPAQDLIYNDINVSVANNSSKSRLSIDTTSRNMSNRNYNTRDSEIPAVNDVFDNHKPYNNNGKYNGMHRDSYKNRYETFRVSSYRAAAPNTRDAAFRNDPYNDDFNSTNLAGSQNYRHSFPEADVTLTQRKNFPGSPTDNPLETDFLGHCRNNLSETFPSSRKNDFVEPYMPTRHHRNFHPNTYARNNRYDKDFSESAKQSYMPKNSYNADYNGIPSNEFPNFQSCPSDFGNTFVSEQGGGYNNESFNRGYDSKPRRTSPSNDLYSQGHQEKQWENHSTNIYRPYDTERELWDNRCQPNSVYPDTFMDTGDVAARNTFDNRRKGLPWHGHKAENSFGKRKIFKRGRGNHRFQRRNPRS